jgi:hypothetical protein
MPSRKKATLRSLHTTEENLHFATDCLKAYKKFKAHVNLAARNGAEVLVSQLQQAQSELATALQVAERMHQLRLQEIQNTVRFPDEDKDSN